MKRIMILTLVALVVAFQGCGKPLATTTTPTLSMTASKTVQTTSIIKTELVDVATNVDYIKMNSTDTVIVEKAVDMEKHLEAIILQLDTIVADQGNITATSTQLYAKIDKLEKENTKLKADINSWANRVLGLMLIFSVLGLASSVGIFIWGNKKFALTLAAVSIVLFGSIEFFQTYQKEIMYGSALLFAIVGAYYLIQWIQQKHALTQVVNFVDTTVKPALTKDIKEKIFGNLADKAQSPTTQKLVSTIRVAEKKAKESSPVPVVK